MPHQDAPASPSLTPQELLKLAGDHRKLLIWSALLGAMVALAATIVVPRNWSSHQGLLIRSDAAGYADQRLGKFTDLAEMKTVQETLLELSKSQTVIRAALTQVGPRKATKKPWPSERDVVDFRDQIIFSPPGGAEFGKTEVFYLGVLSPDRNRAAMLVDALTGQLEQRLRSLRDQRATSMVQEVERSVTNAQGELDARAKRLSAFEQRVGADLVELRHLTSPSGGQSEIAQRALAIENERRQSEERTRRNRALLAELSAASDDPIALTATPDTLLTAQPGLRRLKQGLIEAQLSVARIGGARTANHPFVQSARLSQQKILDELNQQLPTIIASVELDLEVSAAQEAALSEQLQQLRDRSAQIAGLRTEYAELTAEVDGQTAVLRAALKQLADAEAHQAAAKTTSLLERIDAIETSVRPVGPSRKAVVGAGCLGALLLSASWIVLRHGPVSPTKPSPVTPKNAEHEFPAAKQDPVASAWAVELEPAPAANAKVATPAYGSRSTPISIEDAWPIEADSAASNHPDDYTPDPSMLDA